MYGICEKIAEAARICRGGRSGGLQRAWNVGLNRHGNRENKVEAVQVRPVDKASAR